MGQRIRIIPVLLSLLLCMAGTFSDLAAQVTEKNGFPQPPNYDFEVWDSDVRPWAWSSSSNFEAGNAASRYARNQSVWQSTDVRPGSEGSRSVRIQVTQSSWYHYSFPFGSTSYVDMGTLTTGTLYYYDSKDNSSSCIYTKTSDGSKSWAFSGRPDSIVFWAKLGENGGRNGDMTLYLHDGSDLEDRGSGNTVNGTVIGSAHVKIQYNGGQWTRYSVPVQYASTSDPAYLLLSFTAGNSFREVVNGDQMWVDDVLLVYNPSMSIGADCPTRLVRHGGTSQNFSIPYDFSAGTLEPLDPSAANEIRAYLSDENGSFDNSLQIGWTAVSGFTQSGSLSASIPADLPDSDKYRLRLESTNYPVQSIELPLTIYREWYLDVRASNAMGSVNPAEGQQLVRHNSTQTLEASPHPDCVFSGWQENGQWVARESVYRFTMTEDRDLLAVFDTTYTLHLAQVVGASSYFANNNAQDLTVVAGDTARLRLNLDYGYAFSGYDFMGQLHSENVPSFDFVPAQGGTVLPLVDSIPYEFVFEVLPDAKLGSVEGGGIHKHFSSFTASARAANPYSHFLRWEDSTGQILGTDTLLSFENIRAGGRYRAVFEEDFHSVRLSLAEGQESWGSVLQNGRETADSLYSAFDTMSLRIEALPAEAYGFVRYDIEKDGIGQSPSYANPLVLVESGHLDADYRIVARFDTARYSLEVSARNGRVSGAGQYRYGESALLRAFAGEGYHLEAWQCGDLRLAPSDTLRVQVFSDTLVEAVFALDQHEIRMAALPEGWGSLEPGTGFYTHFDTLALRAVPEGRREVRYWIVDGDTVSDEPAYTHVVRGPAHICVVFGDIPYRLQALSSNLLWGYVEGSGNYAPSTEADLRAVPFEGYEFLYWENEDGGRCESNPLHVGPVVSDTVLTAVFAARAYELEIRCHGEGYVLDKEGEVLEQASPVFGEELRLQAVAREGESVFVEWQDLQGRSLGKQNPLLLRASSDTVLVAVFGPETWRLDLFSAPAVAGTLSGAGDYPQGSEVEIGALPLPGYAFEAWYCQDTLVAETPSLEFVLDGNACYVARFRALSCHVGLKAEPEQAVSALDGGGDFKTGDNSLLRVTPADGYELAAWIDAQGDTLGTENPWLYPVSSDAELTALMQAARLKVDYKVEPASAGRVEAEVCRYGQSVRVEAVPAYGYRFSAWTDAEGNPVSESPSFEFSSRNDTGFTARFDLLPFLVEAEAGEGGQVEGAGEYPYGAACVLKAEAEPHYRFAGWFDSEGTCVGMQPEWEFPVEGPRRLEARFETLPVTARLVVHPAGAGTVYASGRVAPASFTAFYKSDCQWTALASPAFELEGWQIEKEGRKEVFPAVDTLRWTLEGDEIVTALFDTAYYVLQAETEGLPQGLEVETEGFGPHAYGTEVRLHVEEPGNYYLVAWNDAEGNILSQETELSWRVGSDQLFHLEFAPRRYPLRLDLAGKPEGVVSGAGIHAYDSLVTVQAWPVSPTVEFSHWASVSALEDTLSRESSFSYRVQGPDTLYAFFKDAGYLLETGIQGEGSVDGQGVYPAGSTAKLSARAAEGYHFAAWMENGNIVGTGAALDWSVERPARLLAVFEPDTFQLALRAVLDGESGNASGEGNLLEEVVLRGAGSYAYGSPANVYLSALPEALRLSAWVDGNGNPVSEERAFVHTVTEDVVLEARVAYRTCRIEAETEGEGRVSGAGSYPYGDTACLVASASEGYRLQAWMQGDVLLSQEDTLRVPLRSDMECRAVFVADEIFVNAVPNQTEGGSVEGNRMASVDENVVFTARPAEGYRFLYWSQGDSLLSEDSRLELPAQEVAALVAHFEEVSFRLRLQTDTPQGVLSLSGAGSYRKGEEASLGISLREGYRFEAWYRVDEGREEWLSDQENFVFEPGASMQIEARVSKIGEER